MGKIYGFQKNIGGVTMEAVIEMRIPREEVERRAESILGRYGIKGIPVDPLVIASIEKIAVKNAVFKDQNVSGLISKQGNEISIYVRNEDAANRKKFTIAHELGHFFLHLQEVDGDFVEFSGAHQYENPNREIEANQFASAMLMPRNHLETAWQMGLSIDEMAKKFGVSADSMKYRLVDLGFLSVGMI
ncbi:MAG TPA: ImmA/IrrE family metallo-endopeptidase [Bacilli bacterium]|nr:ImmA/IrrE family metallo-endopeptidase [Bacilli bacterium]